MDERSTLGGAGLLQASWLKERPKLTRFSATAKPRHWSKTMIYHKEHRAHRENHLDGTPPKNRFERKRKPSAFPSDPENPVQTLPDSIF
jgi:hypothetical protein